MKAPSKKPLGRGLGSLIPGAGRNDSGTPTSGAQELEIRLLANNPRQMRVHFDPAALESLAESIRKKGVLEPVLVRPLAGGKYELIAGERRTRAARLAGLEKIPAIVKELSDRESLEIALLENLMREDLSPVEEARGYQKLVDEFGYTHEQIASRTGLDRATVTNALRLLKLPSRVLEEVEKGSLTAGHAKALLGLDHADQILSACMTTVQKGLSVRETEHLVQKIKAGHRPSDGKKASGRLDPNIRQLVEDLSRQLGVRVELQPRSAGKGKLIIHYATLDSLDTVLSRLKKR